jgi:ABC-type glycerol-3-phosphate transport system permease component
MTPMQRSSRIVNIVGALIILLFTGGPVVLSFVGSVVPDRVMFASDKGLFDEVTIENYSYMFTGKIPPAYLKSGANRTMISDAARQMPLSLWNSFQISISVFLLNLLLGAPAAFIYAHYAFPGKKITFLFLILSPLVPTVALITPIYMMIQLAGLLATKAAIILVHTSKTLPFTLFILSVFFRKMPKSLLESAMLEGCSRFQAFIRIVVPIGFGPMMATGLFSFMLSYAEFMFSNALSGQATSRPVSVVAAALARNPDVSWSLLNTAIFVAIVPTLILVVLVWRYVVADLVRGAVKE